TTATPAPTTTAPGGGGATTDVVPAITIAAPTDLQLTLEATGRLTVSFTPSATNAGGALRYRLMREDGGRSWPGTDRTFTDVPGSPAVIDGLGPDERPCVTIIAVLDPGAQTSVPSELV